MSDLAYAAHTNNAIYFLDADGICQDVTATSADAPPAELLRCIGAQFVAALDARAQGGLAALPREGATMLFVAADAHMRFALLRTAVVTRFRSLAEPDSAEDVVVPLTVPKAPAPTKKDAAPALELTITWPSADDLARAFPLSRYGMVPGQGRAAGALLQ